MSNVYTYEITEKIVHINSKNEFFKIILNGNSNIVLYTIKQCIDEKDMYVIKYRYIDFDNKEGEGIIYEYMEIIDKWVLMYNSENKIINDMLLDLEKLSYEKCRRCKEKSNNNVECINHCFGIILTYIPSVF